jgi:DNA-binding transcriptional ArsR family regulator
MYYQNRMERRNPVVVDVTVPATAFELEVVASTAVELLVLLFARAAADGGTTAVGDRTGEVWLHLLGVSLEAGVRDAESFVAVVDELRPLELRRHILGAYVPSWRHVAGAQTIERAARGDEAAGTALLANDRYYGGKARAALARILPLSAAETKARITGALAVALEAFGPREAEVRAALEADAEAKLGLLRRANPLGVIDAAAGGYRYEAEAEFPRVVLIPQLAAAPSLLLCQHGDARLICYPVASEVSSDRTQLLALGRALGDDKRLALLDLLRAGEATLGELAHSIGLAKSTTHHHLRQLRAAGIVALHGNADRYTYAFNPEGFRAASELLERITPR